MSVARIGEVGGLGVRRQDFAVRIYKQALPLLPSRGKVVTGSATPTLIAKYLLQILPKVTGVFIFRIMSVFAKCSRLARRNSKSSGFLLRSGLHTCRKLYQELGNRR